LPIGKTKTGFLLEFIPDLFRDRNDKLKKTIVNKKCHACEGRHPAFKFLLEFNPDLFMGRNDKRAREREMRLLVGATLCGRRFF